MIENKFFCIVPWIHTYLGPDNKRNLCCVSDVDFIDYELEKIWNCDKMKSIRLNMLNEIEIDGCKRCPINISTYRTYWNFKFKHLIQSVIEKTEVDGTYNEYPISIDYRTNICNFKCKTCNSVFSSSIFNERLKNNDLIEQEIIDNKRQINNNNIIINKEIDLLINKGNIIDIYWAGGEPLYYISHWKTLLKLIKTKKSNFISLRYSTNLSTLKYKNINLIDCMDKFKYVEIIASLDGTNDIGEWIRSGLIYDNWLNNFKELCEYRKINSDKIRLVISTVLTLPSLIDLVNLNKLSNDFDVELQLQEAINTNKLLMIRHYPKYIIIELIDSIKLRLYKDGGKNVENIVKFLDNILSLEFYNDLIYDDKEKILSLESNRPQKNVRFEDIISINDKLKKIYDNI